MGSIENTTSIKTAIMMKIILAVCLSVLAFQTVDAKKCYMCGTTSGSPMDVDNCGNFDDNTPTCTLTGDNKCRKESGTTFCCCDGDLCNSGHQVYGSLIVLL